MNIATTGIVKGSLSLNKERRRWVIEAEHDVMRLLKRMFERIPAAAVGQVELADNARARAELYWVLARWRFDVSAEDAALVEAGMLQERAREERAAAILAPEYVPRRIDLALPLRPYQRLVADIVLEQGFLLSADEMGLGKAQPLDALVLTPWGWIEMGEIRPGQIIIGRSGNEVRVKGVYPQGEKDIYAVHLSDGAVVECCNDHLWSVQTPLRKWRGATSLVLPLHELRQRLRTTEPNA